MGVSRVSRIDGVTLAKLFAMDIGDFGFGFVPVAGDAGGFLGSITLFKAILPEGCWEDISPGTKKLLYTLWAVDALIGVVPGLGDMSDLLPVNTINGLIVKAHLDKMSQR